MSKEISLLILIETKPGLANEQVQAFKKLQPIVLAEKGCLQYELSRVTGDENKFLLIEKWASQEDLSAHDQTAHMVAADAHSPSFRAKPAQVFELEKIS
jgi:quinol monooxygenase YgiN